MVACLRRAFLTAPSSSAFSPDSRILATGGREGSIVFWDVETRQPIGELLPPGGDPVKRLTFSPDGKLLASHVGNDRRLLESRVGDDGRLRLDRSSSVTLWDVARRRPIDRPFDEDAGSKTLSFSPDGRLLMSAGDGRILLYNVEQQKLKTELTHKDGLVDTHAGAVFSVDGRQVLSLTKTSLLTWDMASRRSVEEPVRTRAAIIDTFVHLSPDGKLLALVSADGLRLFDAMTRQPLGDVFGGMGFNSAEGLSPARRQGHVGFSPDGRQFVMGGVFSPDGKWLVSRAIGSPFVWDIDIERWLTQACQLVNRDLTAAEWRRYAGTDVSYVSACPVPPRASAP
jgi:WD40 repeat protein